MAIVRKSALVKMTQAELEAKLFEIRRELNTERGLAASGGRSQNPGKIRELRRTVARILTIMPQRFSAAKSDKKEQKGPAAPKTAAAVASTRGGN
ncbi:MAG: 50S ribosomal protein L29 [Candidatus Micrarchaeota archaeon]